MAGLRFEHATRGGSDVAFDDTAGTFVRVSRDDDPFRADRTRISPLLVWHPSEFSRLRLQYNYDDRQGFGSDHSIWLQFEFLLGAHAAHRF